MPAFFPSPTQSLLFKICFFVIYSQVITEITGFGRVGGTKIATTVCMIELVLKITSAESGMPAMIHALECVMFQARLERACLDCHLYAETGNPQSLLYVEQWSTLQDLESQLRSQRFGMLLAIMETAPEPPELGVRTISEQRDLEYVSAVRLNPNGTTPVTEDMQLGS